MTTIPQGGWHNSAPGTRTGPTLRSDGTSCQPSGMLAFIILTSGHEAKIGVASNMFDDVDTEHEIVAYRMKLMALAGR